VKKNKVEQLNEVLPSIQDAHGNLRKEGPTSLCGPCPKCDGVDRFVYRTDSKKFWCRQCYPENKPGDKIGYHKWIEGLSFKDLVKKYLPDPEPFEHYQLGFPIEKYPYTDATGKVLYYNCRFEPKTFRQCRADGLKWSVKDIKKVPYQLPKVAEAKTVFILNGEKACNRMNDIGQVGTCNVAGEGNWTSNLNPYFKGKQVVIIPDNDEKGRQHADKVYHELKDVAASVKVIELPGLPKQGDFVDWFDAFDDMETAAEQLAIMVDGAEPFSSDCIKNDTTIEDSILEIDQFCKLDLTERQEYLSPWIKEGSIGLISGWRGAGKTWFAMGLLDAISRGGSFGPWECKVSIPCLLLDGEMPAQDIIERSNDLRLTSIRKNHFYIYSDAYTNRLGLPRAHLANEEWRQKMKQRLITRNVKLWVIDNLASLAGGLDENVKKDWDPINSWLLELRFAGISTIMLHHVNKDGGQRGTSAREDNIDTSIVLKTPHDYHPEDGARFIVRFTKSRVKTSDLHLVADTEFKLIHDENKNLVWAWGSVRAETKKEVLRLLDEGMSQADVKNTLGIDKSYVSRIRKKAVKDNFLTPKNKLTQEGFMAING